MSKLDETKERLINLRFWLGVIVGVFLAVVGWVATNYKNADNILLFWCALLIVVCIIAFVFIMQTIEKRLKEIKDL